ncbi:MAG: hypothetical protein Q9M19_03515 [Mariprofundaceae bacterium]|nr:hypothetical protein [Mariprofundaceae bacterium]
MKIFLKILLLGVLASCGGGNSVTPNPQVTTIGGTDQSQFTLANFSDADWLYNNYFGEYNLPAGFKASIIDDLKRAANSMVMYDAQGGDSQQMIVKMDMMARVVFLYVTHHMAQRSTTIDPTPMFVRLPFLLYDVTQ